MMNDLMKQEEKIYFDQIVKLTEKGTINWECTEYNPIGFLDKDSFSEQSACITQMFNFTTIAGGFLHELELAEYVYVPSGKIDICATLTREDEKHFLKIDSFLSIELDQQNDTEPMDINKVSVVRLAKYLIPIAVETASVSEAFEWARYFNCQRRTVKNLKRRPENDPNAGNIAPVIYAGTLSAGQLSAGSSAGGTGWTPAFHRSLSR